MSEGSCPYRTLFLSDIHLGTHECRAQSLLEFLQQIECQRLVLVGDIFDLWAMRRRVVWSDSQDAIVARILDLAARGTEVIYIPGNHDERLRGLSGTEILGVRIVNRLEHQTADGRRFLVTHGDEFDPAVGLADWKHRVGDLVYRGLLRTNHWVDLLRRYAGLRPWSLLAWTQARLKGVREYIQQFETAAVAAAIDQGFDGYIGGHIHRPAIADRVGRLYCNTGDWVEHCSALVEDASGNLRLIHWSEAGQEVPGFAEDPRLWAGAPIQDQCAGSEPARM